MAEQLRIVGLDLSLTSSGMSDGWNSKVVRTPPDIRLEERLEQIQCAVRTFVRGPHFAVIEGSAYGAQGRGREELAAVRSLVKHALWTKGVPFITVAPMALKKFTAGKGTASKNDMLIAVRDRYGVDFGNVPVAQGRYDLVDGYALAALGYAAVGASGLYMNPGVTPTGYGTPVFSAVGEDMGAVEGLARRVEAGELT